MAIVKGNKTASNTPQKICFTVFTPLLKFMPRNYNNGDYY